jgi:hypothetical protein
MAERTRAVALNRGSRRLPTKLINYGASAANSRVGYGQHTTSTRHEPLTQSNTLVINDWFETASARHGAPRHAD